jgi:ABC-2 type transport system ATP-binding protein
MLLLSIQNIKKYFGTYQALKGISLDLHRGEVFSLLGVNGAGKTTLSSIIATLRPPSAGGILFNGVPIYKNLIAYRQAIGYCPQKPNLNRLLTVEQNLAFAGSYYGLNKEEVAARIKILAQQFELKKYMQHKPNELSGGYQQRVSIARSLLHQPQLLILDEPTVALDPHVRHQLWDFIKQIRSQGITVILTTHYLEEAEVLSDRVCLLDKGSIDLIDTPANLMKKFEKGRLEDVFIHLTQETPE